ncbi:MAG: acyltransferase family protein, partial [Rhodanobacteraceae bacterium]
MSSNGEAAVGLHLEAAPGIRDTAPAKVRAHSNNFDAIRLVAALLVLCSHQLFFLGMAQPTLGGHTLGELAVMMFFVISGYLVAESWYRDPHLVRFILRRFLRLWPALAVATVVIALVSLLVTSMPLGDYLGGVSRHFIARNLQLRIVYELPGVFTAGSSAAMSAVNGSWWTIPVEAKCYLYLALLGLIGLRRRWLSVVALAVVAFLYFRALPGHNLKYLYIGFFATGLCARQFTAEILRRRILWSCAGLIAFVAAVATSRQDLATWIIVAPLVLVIGSLNTPGVRSAGRFGDLSYGIYIYAYFVQQLSVRYWPGSASLAGSLAVS